MNPVIKRLVLRVLAATSLLSLPLVSSAEEIALRVWNGQYVCAEDAGGGAVVADRTAIGPWEVFNVNDLNGGGLESGDAVTFQTLNGYYLCAEGGGGQALVADRTEVGGWEIFTVYKLGGEGSISLGDQIYIQACDGNFVCAEDGGGRELVANRSEAGDWETFTLESSAGSPPPPAGETVAAAVLPYAEAAPVSAVPLYRLYGGGGNNDHFYTTNYGEAMAAANSGYSFEGIACYVESSAGAGRTPLYRYFSRWYGRHFYTTNWNELGGGNAEWAYEGVQCYVYTAQSRSGTVPLFRYAATAGGHLYSIAPTHETFGWEPIIQYILVYDPSSTYGWTYKSIIVGYYGSHNYEGVQGYVFAP